MTDVLPDVAIQSHFPALPSPFSPSRTNSRGTSADSIVSSSVGSIDLIGGIVAGVSFLVLGLIAVFIFA
jgi:hypothetical protein